MMKKAIVLLILLLVSSVSLAQEERPEGWDEASHGNDVEPDYDVVFPDDAVNTITITIEPEVWQVMFDDMTDLYGEFGSNPGRGGGQPGQPPVGFEPPQGGGQPGQPPEGFDPSQGGGQPGQPPEGFDPSQGGGQPFDPLQGRQPGQVPENFGGMMGMEENPVWVPVTVEFNDEVWTYVGMRFKGNSSLSSGWGTGVYKLPFRLDFDEFEDEYPETDNQRFYGFKKLTFSSNWSDDSFLRERVTADIFRDAGVPAAETAFYDVYVDYGKGPVYFGLYTAVEAIDDTMIETQFADDGGNLYKPEGIGATFAAGTFTEDSFDKETNEDEADYSDVLAVFDALHADTRTTDPETWRANLEAVFDVDMFMRWLAVNSTIQNWDTYGSMSHNYYLYNNNGQLTWIPWDNNMALSSGFDRRGNGTTVLGLDAVGENWSLIRYLMDDPVYEALYREHLAETITVFEPSRMTAIYEEMHDLIAPYVAAETVNHTYLTAYEDFDLALDELIQHVQARYATVQDYLAE